MQDDYLDPAPIQFAGNQGFTIQPYHSPTSQNIFANNAILSTTYPLSSHERQLLRLDTSGYHPILPKPPPTVPQEVVDTRPAVLLDRQGAESSEEGSLPVLPVPESADDDGIIPEVEYVNPQCVVYTYYTGDVNSVVDEHFKRSLSRPSSFSSEPVIRGDRQEREEGVDMEDTGSPDPKQAQDADDSGIETNESPVQSSSGREEKASENCKEANETELMCRRKLPPSFWNSDYWREANPNTVVPHDGNTITYLNEYGTVGSFYHQSPLNGESTPYRNTDNRITSTDQFPGYRPRLPEGTSWYNPYGSPTQPQSAFTTTTTPHTPGVDLSLGGYTPESPFNPMYNSLLMQPSVRSTLLPALPGQTQFPRPSATADAWNPVCGSGLQAIQQYYSELPTYDIDSAPTIDSGDPSKDLLWF